MKTLLQTAAIAMTLTLAAPAFSQARLDGTRFEVAAARLADEAPLRGARVLLVNAQPARIAAHAAQGRDILAVVSNANLERSSELVGALDAAGAKRFVVGELTISGAAPLGVEEALKAVQAAKGATYHPVSTAESFGAWMKHPELAAAVDFIALHASPFEDGVPASEAVEYVLEQWSKLSMAYPNKPVVITRLDWPVSGPSHVEAIPSESARFEVLSGFDVWARAYNIEFYVPRPGTRAVASTRAVKTGG